MKRNRKSGWRKRFGKMSSGRLKTSTYRAKRKMNF